MNNLVKRIFAAFMATVATLALTACSGDDGDKPSKDDVKAGFKKVVTTDLGQEMTDKIGDEMLTKYIGCIVDEIYDDMGSESLKAIADSDMDFDMKKEDQEKLDKATEKCTNELLR